MSATSRPLSPASNSLSVAATASELKNAAAEAHETKALPAAPDDGQSGASQYDAMDGPSRRGPTSQPTQEILLRRASLANDFSSLDAAASQLYAFNPTDAGGRGRDAGACGGRKALATACRSRWSCSCAPIMLALCPGCSSGVGGSENNGWNDEGGVTGIVNLVKFTLGARV